MDFIVFIIPVFLVYIFYTFACHDTGKKRIPLELVMVGILLAGIVSIMSPILLIKPISNNVYAGFWVGEQFKDYWNATRFHFDHPEPNYIFVDHIAEF
jgi:hypothetical protein